jgi:RimJ/RimL family protein N-acetyltransferase
MGLFGVIPVAEYTKLLQSRVPKDVLVSVGSLTIDGIQIALRFNPAPKSGKRAGFIGSCCLSWISGTVAASTELFIAEKFRRKGYSGVLEILKVAAAKRTGITMLVATVKHTNEAEIGAIQKHGWQRMAKLNDEDLWGKILNDTPTYLALLERTK